MSRGSEGCIRMGCGADIGIIISICFVGLNIVFGKNEFEFWYVINELRLKAGRESRVIPLILMIWWENIFTKYKLNFLSFISFFLSLFRLNQYSTLIDAWCLMYIICIQTCSMYLDISDILTQPLSVWVIIRCQIYTFRNQTGCGVVFDYWLAFLDLTLITLVVGKSVVLA